MWISMPLVGHVKGTLRESTEHRENAASIFSEVEPRRLRVREQRLKANSRAVPSLNPHIPQKR